MSLETSKGKQKKKKENTTPPKKKKLKTLNIA